MEPSRIRRKVIFQRVLARLQAADPGRWVLKGGMALETRLGDQSRTTKDIDLGSREQIETAEALHEELIAALSEDPDEDYFKLTVSKPKKLAADTSGQRTWRASVRTELAGKTFGSIPLDISGRSREIDHIDVVQLPNELEFAGIAGREIVVVDLHRHSAEKFHAISRSFGDRENTRVRDLVDLTILSSLDKLDSIQLREMVKEVWTERESEDPPGSLPPFPSSWEERYETSIVDIGLEVPGYQEAESQVRSIWSHLAFEARPAES